MDTIIFWFQSRSPFVGKMYVFINCEKVKVYLGSKKYADVLPEWCSTYYYSWNQYKTFNSIENNDEALR